MKKVNRCEGGGFLKLQELLLSEKPVTCPACLVMLTVHKFDKDGLKEAIDAVLKGERDPKDRWEKSSEQELTKEQASLLDRKTRKRNRDDGDEAKADRDQGPDACLEYVRKFQGIIELLPSGTQGKKVPYRCLVCKTKSQPRGRVGELGMMKLYMFEHFLEQHMDSISHKKALRKANNLQDPRPLVKCQGLSVNDEETAGKLYEHKELFHLWASVCNFQACAKHSYWCEANTGSWCIRAADCEGETEAAEDPDGRNVCGACLQLGLPHSVTWMLVGITQIQLGDVSRVDSPGSFCSSVGGALRFVVAPC